MRDPGDESLERPKRDLFPLISNAVLVVVAIGFLWVALSRYQYQIGSVSLTESRFLTTEWHLLQRLKAQTDQQLLEKEQEIADLNRRYLRLVQGHASEAEVRQIEARLQQAQTERQQIIERRDATASGVSSSERTWIAGLLPSSDESALTKLLQQQIETLRAQLSESGLQIDELVSERASLATELERLGKEHASAAARDEAKIQELSATVASQELAAHRALDAVSRQAREVAGIPGSPSLQDLDTRALVRALIGSPTIRAKYPDLLAALDRYFEQYALQERSKGRQEAYASAEAALAPLAAQNDPPQSAH